MVFLSYRQSDLDKVLRFASELENSGVNLWLDYKRLKAGQDFMKGIEDAINRSDIFLVFLTKNMTNLENTFSGEELKLALKRLRKDSNFKISLVKADDEVKVPIGLHFEVVDFSNESLKEKNYQRLVNSLM